MRRTLVFCGLLAAAVLGPSAAAEPTDCNLDDVRCVVGEVIQKACVTVNPWAPDPESMVEVTWVPVGATCPRMFDEPGAS